MARRLPSPLEHPLRVIATPATKYTGEKAIVVKVSSDASRTLPVIGTTYQAARICQARMSEFKNYVCSNIRGEGEYFYVYFSKDKTTTEVNTPYHSEIKTEN